METWKKGIPFGLAIDLWLLVINIDVVLVLLVGVEA